MWAIIASIVSAIFAAITGRKQAAGVAQGKAEHSNEQLKVAAKQKDEALNERLEIDDKAERESDADALGRLR